MKRVLYSSCLASTALIGMCGSLIAQPLIDLPRGVDVTFNVSEAFEYNSNPNLRTDGGDSETSFVSSLGFAYASETRIQSFTTTGSVRLRFNSDPEPGTDETTFEVQPIRVSYDRAVKSSSFGISGRYSNQSIAYLQPFDTFYDAEIDAFVLPEDIDDLYGDGQREDLGVSARLTLGEGGPLTLRLRGNYDQTRYVNTADLLDDYDVYGVNADLSMRITPVTSADISASYRNRDEYGAGEDDSETQSVRVSVSHEFTKTVSATARIGQTYYTDSDENREGLAAGLDVTIERPIGTIGANLSLFPDTGDSNRLEGSLRRTYEFRSGATLQGTFGGSLNTDGVSDPSVIADLRYNTQNRYSTFSVNLNRSFRFDGDEDNIQTVARANMGYELSEVSGISFGASYIATEGLDSGSDDQRTGINASYNHALTEDWNLNFGVGYNERRQSDVETVDNQSFSIGLRRAFSY